MHLARADSSDNRPECKKFSSGWHLSRRRIRASTSSAKAEQARSWSLGLFITSAAGAAAPFVAVNVAALNPSLVESELFGHVRGAFTGAEQSHRGLLQQSSGGTIFFDEVADIPASLQVKLLRAVEQGEILPVGSATPVAIDLRVVSATHQNLLNKVNEGSFRHDLYFRLTTFQIDIPPLRERRDDIRPLAEYFLATMSERNQRPPPLISADALEELERRQWPGNVREMKNAVEHAIVLSRGETVSLEHLPNSTATLSVASGDEPAIAALIRDWAQARLGNGDGADDLYQRLLALVEPPLLAVVLEKHHGQRGAAARTLGLHRMTLRKKLAKLGLDERDSDE